MHLGLYQVGPFIVTNVFPRGAIEIKSLQTNKDFWKKTKGLGFIKKMSRIIGLDM